MPWVGHMRRRVGVAVDLALILLVVLTAWRLVGPSASTAREEGSRSLQAIPPPIELGSQLSLRSAAPQFRHVVLSVSESCQASRQSLDFYRRLSSAAPAIRIALLTSGEPERVRGWLVSEGVRVDEVLAGAPIEAGVVLTPTVLILDESGRVTDGVAGKASALEEQHLLRRLQNRGGAPVFRMLSARTVSKEESERLVSANRAILLNVQERAPFGARETTAGKHIPLQEFAERLLAELAPDQPVIVDCRQPLPRPACDSATATLLSESFTQVFALR
jgi:hypothetical protein